MADNKEVKRSASFKTWKYRFFKRPFKFQSYIDFGFIVLNCSNHLLPAIP
jgi:hypothetical protein